MAYDVAAIRARFPSLTEGAAHFDSPGGSLVPDVVGSAIAATITSAIANRGTVTPAELRAERAVAEGRQAMADLLGADPRGVIFGRSMTALTFDLARTLAATWAPGDEVVVTRLDHDANIRPWVIAAERVGAVVRWAEFDPETGELSPEAVAAVIGPRTRLVAVTGASNLIGTRPDLPAIADLAHAAGALLFVDAVHLAAHAALDLVRLGADFIACSPYKFMGPHLGVLAADPALLESLSPDKLLPSSTAVPDRFELGTLPYELLAGTTAAVDFIATLGSDQPGVATDHAAHGGSRRTAVLASMAAAEQHEDRLRERLEAGLAALPGVTLYSRAAHRTPTLLASFERHDSQEVRTALARVGVNAPASNFYAIEASRRLGLGDSGALRMGLAPYSDDSDVDRLLDGLGQALGS